MPVYLTCKQNYADNKSVGREKSGAGISVNNVACSWLRVDLLLFSDIQYYQYQSKYFSGAAHDHRLN